MTGNEYQRLAMRTNDGESSLRLVDKIAQIVIMKIVSPTFVQVDQITGGDRGDRGFGSTGK